MKKARIAIFASGAGSNAEKIIGYFNGHPAISVGLVCCNKPGAGVLDVAEKANIPQVVFSKTDFSDSSKVEEALKQASITHIILAGFLLMIPEKLLKNFHGKIINIHPALLPKFGGKGMYGDHVHLAVKNSQEGVTGITIHEVNEKYDEGKIILQKSISLTGTESIEQIAQKVQGLEHQWYPVTIEKWINGTN